MSRLRALHPDGDPRCRTTAYVAVLAVWFAIHGVLLSVGTNGGATYLTGAVVWALAEAVLILVTAAVPWQRVPRAATAALPLLAMATVLPLQLGIVNHWDPDYGFTLLVPLMWLAVWYGWRTLAGGLVMAALVLVAPVVATWAWPAGEILDQVVTASIYSAIAILVGVSLHVVSRADRRSAGLEALASVDSLTGLPNRSAWMQAVTAAVTHATRANGDLTLAIVDIRGFRTYNDDHGNLAGDQLLVDCAATWSAALDSTDLFARIGGDEFGLLLARPAAEADALVRAIPGPGAPGPWYSAGIATWTVGESVAELLGRTAAALFRAQHRRHTPHEQSVVVSDDEDSGIAWGEFIPRLLRERAVESVYQPICRLDDGGVVGYEALARPTGWAGTASVEGLFAAARYLGLGRDLDVLCRRRAIQGASSLAAGVPLFINIGVGALLDGLGALEDLCGTLLWCRRSPNDVVLEISEAIGDLARFETTLALFRSAGFRFAIDDIGDAHTTLESLAASNPEFLKISRSLVIQAADPGRRATIHALVEFARSSGAAVIAEGIEDAETSAVLADLGVRLGQGFGLGKPGRLPLDAELPLAGAGRRAASACLPAAYRGVASRTRASAEC